MREKASLVIVSKLIICLIGGFTSGYTAHLDTLTDVWDPVFWEKKYFLTENSPRKEYSGFHQEDLGGTASSVHR